MTTKEVYEHEASRGYWRIAWDPIDTIYYPCGHGGRTRVEWLESDKQINQCPYINMGMCKGEKNEEA